MSKKNEVVYENGSYLVKKSRKGNIIAFIVCLLVAMAIWLYASQVEDDKELPPRDDETHENLQSEASSESDSDIL